MVYFYTPSQVIEKEAPLEKFIRVGGMVKKGSVLRSNNNLKISFKIYDLEQQINVMYEGILPDLFAEGQGVVMTGRLINSNTFIADEVLAKHDENYMPPEVADALIKNGVWQGEKNDPWDRSYFTDTYVCYFNTSSPFLVF